MPSAKGGAGSPSGIRQSIGCITVVLLCMFAFLLVTFLAIIWTHFVPDVGPTFSKVLAVTGAITCVFLIVSLMYLHHTTDWMVRLIERTIKKIPGI